MKNPSEHVEQVNFMRRVRLHLRKYPALELLYAIPNGGDRNVRVARKMKAEGTKRGVPDLHLPVGMGGYNALYIELKAVGGRLSKEQKELIPKLQAENNRVEVAYGAEDAWQKLVNYLES